MREIIEDGIPVLISSKERVPRTVRIKVRPRKVSDMGIKRLKKRQKQAIQNWIDNGGNKKKAAIDAGYSPTNTHRDMTKLLERKPIIKALEKVGVTDDFIAEKIKEGIDAPHPFRPDQKDFHASAKFVSEANKVKDNYPPTKIQSESKEIKIVIKADTLAAIEKVNEMRREHGKD